MLLVVVVIWLVVLFMVVVHIDRCGVEVGGIMWMGFCSYDSVCCVIEGLLLCNVPLSFCVGLGEDVSSEVIAFGLTGESWSLVVVFDIIDASSWLNSCKSKHGESNNNNSWFSWICNRLNEKTGRI